MDCPFELPIKSVKGSVQESLSQEFYSIEDSILIIAQGMTKEQADYIVQAINSHEKRYREGYEDGLRAYAWWKDGIEYVGSCGTTLKQALKEKP